MGGGMETPLLSRCLVPGRTILPPPKADRLLTIATPVQAQRMRVPVGSGLCFSPCPWASTRLGIDPRQTPPRVVLTTRRSCRVLAHILAWDSCQTLSRGAVGLCYHRHGNLRVEALVMLPEVDGVP